MNKVYWNDPMLLFFGFLVVLCICQMVVGVAEAVNSEPKQETQTEVQE